jgi:hypothetical protein
MIKRIWAKHPGRAAACTGVIGVAIYLIMITVTLAHIQAMSGHVPFDMRPVGYGPQDAAAILDGLGVEGRQYYLRRQIPLDTLYPALLAATLIFAMHWFGKRIANEQLERVGIILSGCAALCDYAENLGIVAMILNWPSPSDTLVYASSAASTSKSVLTTLAFLCLMLVGVLWAWRGESDRLSRPIHHRNG